MSIIFNLDDIEAYAAEYPAAAMQCGKALAKFTEGERRAKRRALSTVFLITYNIYHSKDQVDFFNMQYCTYSSTNRKESVEKTHDKLMYRVCEFIYYCFGNATKNNAYIYGHALDYYLKNNEDLSYVKKLIMEHGPEKLYRAALKRNALEEVKTSYEQSGRKIDEPIDQDYLLQVASETNWGERAESLGPPLNDQAQKEQTNETMELTMNRDVASRDDYLDPEYILSNDDDDQETNDDAEDDEDELWNALMRIERKVSRLTSIVLRLETGLNKLTDTLQAR